MRWTRISRPGRPGTTPGRVEVDTVQVFEGDLVLCGTSPGVLSLKPGTAVKVVIDGPGTLRNACG